VDEPLARECRESAERALDQYKRARERSESERARERRESQRAIERES